MRTHISGNLGYTLNEVMVVIVILGIMAAVAIPITRNMLSNTRLMDATEKITTAVTMTRAKALANPRLRAGIYFDKTKKGIVTFFDSNNNNLYDEGSDKVLRGLESLQIGVDFYNDSLSNSVVLFRGDGSAVAGGSIGVTSSSPAKKKKFTIAQLTGSLTVKPD